jgi:hypothetical protein
MVSAVGCMTLLDINRLNLGKRQQSFGFRVRFGGFFWSIAAYIIIARIRELVTNLPGRSFS